MASGNSLRAGAAEWTIAAARGRSHRTCSAEWTTVAASGDYGEWRAVDKKKLMAPTTDDGGTSRVPSISTTTWQECTEAGRLHIRYEMAKTNQGLVRGASRMEVGLPVAVKHLHLKCRISEHVMPQALLRELRM